MPAAPAATRAVVVVAVFLLAVGPALDGDLWWHLRTADWILDHRDWPGADPFTYTRPDVARVQTDWIGQLTLYGLWRAGGLTLVAIGVAVLATVGMVLVSTTVRLPRLWSAGLVVLGAAAASYFWTARTQMFTFLFTAATVAALHGWRDRPRRFWWLVALFLVWANAHGGVVYGVLLLLGTLVGGAADLRRGADALLDRRALRTLAAVTAACVAVLVVNPNGVRIYALPFDQLGSAGGVVHEYRPPDLTDAGTWPFAALLVLTVVAVVAARRRVPLAVLLPALGATVLALRVVRGVSFAATLLVPVAAWAIAARRASQTTDDADDADDADTNDAGGPRWLPAAVVAVGVACAALYSVAVLDDDRVAAEEAERFPVAAAAWIEANDPPGQLYSTFNWGGWLVFHLRDRRVAIDPRTDVYDDYIQTWESTVRAEPGYDDELRRVGANTVLLEPGMPLVRALLADGWREAHRDPVAVVLVRPEPVAVPPTSPLGQG